MGVPPENSILRGVQLLESLQPTGGPASFTITPPRYATLSPQHQISLASLMPQVKYRPAAMWRIVGTPFTWWPLPKLSRGPVASPPSQPQHHTLEVVPASFAGSVIAHA